MFYIGITKNLSNPSILETLKGTADRQEDNGAKDRLIIFFKDSDSLKMTDVAAMLDAGIFPFACERVADRDDMLVMLGACFAQTEEQITLLDPSIPVPKRYADRVKVVKVKALAKPRTRKRPTAKTAATDDAGDAGSKKDEKKTGLTKALTYIGKILFLPRYPRIPLKNHCPSKKSQ